MYNQYSKMAFQKYEIVFAKNHRFLENLDHHNLFQVGKCFQALTTLLFSLWVLHLDSHKPNVENDLQEHHMEEKLMILQYV